MQDRQVRQRVRLATGPEQLLDHDRTHMHIIGRQLGKLAEGLQCLAMLPERLERLGDRQVVALRIDHHPLLRGKPGKAPQRGYVTRPLAENLVAKRDCVVQEATQRILICAPLEQQNSFVNLPQAKMQVAHTVAQGHVDILAAVMFAEQFLIQRERLLGLLLELEGGGLLLEHCR